MTQKKSRCMVCGKEKLMEGSICENCKAIIRQEASEGQRRIKKEADKALKKEGVTPEEK
ncbi:MAG: hypothetical protein OEM19_02165 [Deltaproteobacteria bacterium]|jgi:hypothetical protein|nr:hypothetical protein [Deltaproteobacteria bacterium]